MAGIFISYRREDSAGHTGRLMDELTEGFEAQQIFRDIEAIEAGADFVEAINQAVSSCSVVLVVIGPRWLDAQGRSGKRRLEEEHDFVRLEIAAALAREVRIIPVLVGGASMPPAAELPEAIQPLARRQAHELSDRRWDYDVEQLFAALAKMPGIARRKAKSAGAAPAPAPKRGMSTITKVVLVAIGVFVSLGILGSLVEDDTQAPVVPAAMQPAEQAPASPVASLPAAQQAGTLRSEPRAATPAPAERTTAQPPPRAQMQAAATERVAPDQPIASDPPAALASLTGNWRSPEGDALYFEQTGNALAVMALDSGGMHGFMGEGQVHGQRVEVTLLHLQSGGTLSMQMTLSPDGRRMTGMARENLTGTSQNLVLMRE